MHVKRACMIDGALRVRTNYDVRSSRTSRCGSREIGWWWWNANGGWWWCGGALTAKPRVLYTVHSKQHAGYYYESISLLRSVSLYVDALKPLDEAER